LADSIHWIKGIGYLDYANFGSMLLCAHKA
jgi:hypothetical protein